MIEESGRVVAVKQNNIWVETLRASACGACSAKTGCGQGFLAKALSGKTNYICIHSDMTVAVNDQVIIGLPEHALVKSSFLAYGLPLLSFIVMVVIADTLLGLDEPGTILSGLSGLAGGFFLTRMITRFSKSHAGCQPVILKKLPGEAACMSQATTTSNAIEI